jgi:hypothetical protein
LDCEKAGITPYIPTPLTSGAKAERFGKLHFAYVAEDDDHRCSIGEKLAPSK